MTVCGIMFICGMVLWCASTLKLAWVWNSKYNRSDNHWRI